MSVRGYLCVRVSVDVSDRTMRVIPLCVCAVHARLLVRVQPVPEEGEAAGLGGTALGAQPLVHVHVHGGEVDACEGACAGGESVCK